MLHHDVEEGVQSVLEKLDKIMKIMLRKRVRVREKSHSSVYAQENQSTYWPHAMLKRFRELYSQEPEPGGTQLSINSRVDEYTGVFSYYRIFHSNKKEETTFTYNNEDYLHENCIE